MGPRPTTDEMWGQHFMPPEIQLDILMPNGMLIVLDVRRESNLNQIKVKNLDFLDFKLIY